MKLQPLHWYLILLAVLVLGDRLGGYGLQSLHRDSQFRYARLYRGAAGADILLLGNSRGLAFYQPYLEQITGKTTFNLSYNGLPMDAGAALLADYLERHPPPQLLLIDITLCDRQNPALLSGFLAFSSNSTRLDQLIRRKNYPAWLGSRLFCLFRFNHELYQRSLYYRRNPDTDWLLDRVISNEMAGQAMHQNYRLDADSYQLEQLQSAVDLARRKGIEVRLVVGPVFPAFEIHGLTAFVAKAEQSAGLTVHNYQHALQTQAFFGDYLHLNKQGAIAWIDLMQQDGLLTCVKSTR